MSRLVGWFYQHLRISDFLDLAANGALAAIAVEGVNSSGSISEVSKAILWCGAGYIVFTLLRIGLSVWYRRVRHYEARDSVCQVFHWLYREMFHETPDRRLTLFIRDPICRRHIVPRVQYPPGLRELVFKSAARYSRGEGATGRAWEQTGSLILSRLPLFPNRNEFTAYYENELKIPRSTVDHLSGYMVRVQTIVSYGFLDHKGDLLGIVSLMCRTELKSSMLT